MQLRPLGDTLIVEPDPIVKYEGSLVMPEKNTIEKISPYATIVSAGEGCKHVYMVGQRILIDKFADKPMNFEFEGKKYRFIKEYYIHGVVEDD